MKRERTDPRMDEPDTANQGREASAQGRGRTLRRVTGTQAPVLREGKPYPRQSPPKMKEPLQERVSISPRAVASGVLSQVRADH